jgi:hypothetical protein
MNLESFNFPAVLNTSDVDIITDFFVPALGASVRYDRGVGALLFVAHLTLLVAREVYRWGWWAFLPIEFLGLLLNILINLESDRIPGWPATRYPEYVRILAREDE